MGDSNIFNGVGRKHYRGIEDIIAFIMPTDTSSQHSSSYKNIRSVRNTLNVADIEGAIPSLAPEKVRNVVRAKQACCMPDKYDSL